MPRTPRTPKNASKAKGTPTERPAWPDRFLVALKDAGTISGAARISQVGRRTVYDELARNPDFKADVDQILTECVELVEETLFQMALDPDKTTDRIFYLKTRKPEVYGDKLRQDQIDSIKRQATQEAIEKLDEELQRLPLEVQRIVADALRKTNPKEITP